MDQTHQLFPNVKMSALLALLQKTVSEYACLIVGQVIMEILLPENAIQIPNHVQTVITQIQHQIYV